MSTKPKNQELDLLAESVANAFAAGRSFDELITARTELESRQLMYVARFAMFRILRGASEDFTNFRATLLELERSNLLNIEQLKASALVVLLENDYPTSAEKGVSGISMQAKSNRSNNSSSCLRLLKR